MKQKALKDYFIKALPGSLKFQHNCEISVNSD